MLYKFTVINGNEKIDSVCVCNNNDIIKIKIKELNAQNEIVEYKLIDV